MIQIGSAAGRLLCAVVMSSALACPSITLAQDDGKMEAAEALLEASRVEAMMDQMYAQMPQMLAGMFPTGPDAPPPEDMQALMERALGFLDERIGYEVMKPDYVALYADAYSQEDLVALTEFMESPLGQRFLDATPDLMRRTSVLVQERMGTAMPELMEFLEAEVKALDAEK